MLHGYTSSQRAAGRLGPDDEPGWWDGVIGPGKPIDTDRCFVVSSNMLGSSHGSTGPNSIDPRSGGPYGADFPALTLADIVRAQKRLVDGLGVKHLKLAAGVSYGGFQALQWGIAEPGFVDGLCVVCSAPRGIAGQADAIRSILARDPDWNGGRFYGKPGAMAETMRKIRSDTLRRYGYREIFADRGLDPAAAEAAIDAMARRWAAVFDPHSLLVLGATQERIALDGELGKIRAKLLYILCETDNLFPPSLGPEVMAKLEAAHVDAGYFLLRSRHGHTASTSEPEKWAPALRDFVAGLG